MKQEKESMASPKVENEGLLIIVNYNQIAEIGNFLARVGNYFPSEHTVVVDDASTDGSAELAKHAKFTLIRHSENRGIGAAIRTGIQFALENNYRWVLISSSNGKIMPEEYSRVTGPVIEGRADYVQGNRFIRGGSSPGLPLFRRLSIPLFSAFTSVLLGRRFTDMTCGFRCYRLDLFKLPGVDIGQAWLDRYEMEFYIHFKAVKAGLRILEVPVTIPYSHISPKRFSKIRPFTGWWSMLRPFLILKFRLKS